MFSNFPGPLSYVIYIRIKSLVIKVKCSATRWFRHDQQVTCLH